MATPTLDEREDAAYITLVSRLQANDLQAMLAAPQLEQNIRDAVRDRLFAVLIDPTDVSAQANALHHVTRRSKVMHKMCGSTINAAQLLDHENALRDLVQSDATAQAVVTDLLIEAREMTLACFDQLPPLPTP